MSLTPTGYDTLLVQSSNFERHLSGQSKFTSVKAALDRLIELAQEAVDLTPDGSNDRPGALNNLGSHLSARYQLTGIKADLDRSIKSHRVSSSSLSGLLIHRLKAFIDLLHIYIDAQDWHSAMEAGRHAIQLLPALTPRFLSSSDKHRLLSRISGLASDTAAACLHLGNTLEAVQLLEQGRGVLAGDIFDLRSILPELKRHHHEVAERFVVLDSEVETLADGCTKDLTPSSLIG